MYPAMEISRHCDGCETVRLLSLHTGWVDGLSYIIRANGAGNGGVG